MNKRAAEFRKRRIEYARESFLSQAERRRLMVNNVRSLTVHEDGLRFDRATMRYFRDGYMSFIAGIFIMASKKRFGL